MSDEHQSPVPRNQLSGRRQETFGASPQRSGCNHSSPRSHHQQPDSRYSPEGSGHPHFRRSDPSHGSTPIGSRSQQGEDTTADEVLWSPKRSQTIHAIPFNLLPTTSGGISRRRHENSLRSVPPGRESTTLGFGHSERDPQPSSSHLSPSHGLGSFPTAVPANLLRPRRATISSFQDRPPKAGEVSSGVYGRLQSPGTVTRMGGQQSRQGKLLPRPQAPRSAGINHEGRTEYFARPDRTRHQDRRCPICSQQGQSQLHEIQCRIKWRKGVQQYEALFDAWSQPSAPSRD